MDVDGGEGVAAAAASAKDERLWMSEGEESDDGPATAEPDQLYDPEADDADEKWAEETRQGRQSDAILSWCGAIRPETKRGPCKGHAHGAGGAAQQPTSPTLSEAKHASAPRPAPDCQPSSNSTCPTRRPHLPARCMRPVLPHHALHRLPAAGGVGRGGQGPPYCGPDCQPSSTSPSLPLPSPCPHPPCRTQPVLLHHSLHRLPAGVGGWEAGRLKG
jgi:hypothetical protein